MSDNDSDEPIGRRARTRKSSASTKKKNAQNAAAKTKTKRKIVSSDDENHDSVKKTEFLPVTVSLETRKSIESALSLSPLLSSTLDTPSFSPLMKGPPSPRHRQGSLDWRHKVNLIGEKVVDPMIHICDKCHLPILTYGRMIPCKHVFCLECGRAAEKICHKCGDKVTRIEQTTLGRVFMCTHQQGKTREHCKRTYLSQRDLQAHISHRHVKAKEKVAAKISAPPLPPQTATTIANNQPTNARDPRHTHSSTIPQRSAIPSSPVGPAKTFSGVQPPLPRPSAASVPPLASTPRAASFLTTPHAYPQMVPPPSAVFASGGAPYSGVPSSVPFAPPPHNAYGVPSQYGTPPNVFDDFRGSTAGGINPPIQSSNHWQQRPPRDYRTNGYYRN